MDFTNGENFQRKSPGRNNHNAPKLIEKYNDLAREASSNGDKILSENYLQHADHFTRVLNERENFRREKFPENKNPTPFIFISRPNSNILCGHFNTSNVPHELVRCEVRRLKISEKKNFFSPEPSIAF